MVSSMCCWTMAVFSRASNGNRDKASYISRDAINKMSHRCEDEEDAGNVPPKTDMFNGAELPLDKRSPHSVQLGFVPRWTGHVDSEGSDGIGEGPHVYNGHILTEVEVTRLDAVFKGFEGFFVYLKRQKWFMNVKRFCQMAPYENAPN